MSAIGGIYNLDGAPVDRAVLVELSRGLSSRGPDGGGEYSADSIGMVYRAFHTNRESRLERQPLVVANSHVLCWDGRLDNRDELIDLLRPLLRGERTDAAIVSAAYQQWELEFLGRIIGDFALSLWDIKSKTLILARDHVGPRTLYYRKSGDRIIWTTELNLLLDLTQRTVEVNEDYIAGFLTFLPEPSQTPYKGIDAVPPACAVIIRERKVETKRFWGLDPTREIHYQTDAEYEEHFRHLFREAVQCRLRGDAPIFSELSGGLDSSSIVCMANHLVSNKEVEAPCLRTVSMIFDEAFTSDERRFIEAVERRAGQKSLSLREDDFRLLSPLESDYRPAIPNHMANFTAYYKAICEEMRRNGARVLLSGKGGDEILGSARDPFPELADLLMKGDLLRFHDRLRVWSRALEESYFRVLWRNVIVRLLPRKLQYSRRKGFDQVLQLYDPAFVKRMKLRDRLWGPSDIFGFRQPSRRSRAASFLYVPRELSAGYWRELCNLEFSYPFTHRPLVEFMHAIPYEQLVRPHQSKSLLRRALRDLLPPEIFNRKGKGRNADAFARAAQREKSRLQSMLSEGRACAGGYLNLPAMRAAITNEVLCSPILLLGPFEHWLQSLQQRMADVRP